MPEHPERQDQIDTSALLARWREGDEDARDRLFPLVYQELHQAASRLLGREQPGHTLQPTALVNEVFLKLTGARLPETEGRAHFVGLAARAMRQILVDHARRRRAARRGGGAVAITLENVGADPAVPIDDMLALNDALDRLAGMHPRMAQVIEYRYFGGLTEEETARLLEVTVRTVQRDWTRARAWLYQTLTASPGSDASP
jgi:RNA polymerase sigma factor (TIGR02999 family)